MVANRASLVAGACVLFLLVASLAASATSGRPDEAPPSTSLLATAPHVAAFGSEAPDISLSGLETPGLHTAWTTGNLFLDHRDRRLGTTSLQTLGPLLAVQRAQLDLVPSLLDSRMPARHDDLDLWAAHLVLAHNREFVGALLPASIGAGLDQQDRNLDLAEAIRHTAEEENDQALDKAIADVREIGAWQARSLGLDAVQTIPIPGHRTPSDALLALAERKGVDLTEQDLDRLDRLDAAAPAFAAALARFVDAFLALDAATIEAYRGVNLRSAIGHGTGSGPVSLAGDWGGTAGAVPEASTSAETEPGVSRSGAGIDLGAVFPTRDQFMVALGEVHRSLSGIVPLEPHGDTCAPIQVLPVFSLELEGCDSVYDQDVALLVDVGGSDVYLNNAGGADIACRVEPPGPDQLATAVVVDLGIADDSYGDPNAPRSCGANGGAAGGVGFLFDEAGNDTYAAGDQGTNGGTVRGIGTLIDLSGDDIYAAGDLHANGGASGGAGLILDVTGNDRYQAGRFGTNGGGELRGVAALLDLDGHDDYSAGGSAANGGGLTGGAGFLFDGGGHDTYAAGDSATNGGAGLGGTGFLLDSGGDDAYTTTGGSANGGGAAAGIGLLVDAAGNDTYAAGDFSANGGGDQAGVGILIDQAGDDSYVAGGRGTNGGSQLGASGTLFDGGGDDVYTATNTATNGGAQLGGVGFLLDAAGDDDYLAHGQGTNGGGQLGGLGFLLDAAGDDDYVTQGQGTNGGGQLGGVGFLLDADGHDRYEAGDRGTNGGGDGGAGFLLDGAGQDRYTAGNWSTNGGANKGSGTLIDRSGDDAYMAGWFGTNGGGIDGGSGFLLDQAGSETYAAGDDGTNGGAQAGAGMLIDQSGDDVYIAGDRGVNGGAHNGVGRLLDQRGNDTYLAHGLCAVNGGGATDSCPPLVDRFLMGDVTFPGLGLLLDLGGVDAYREGGQGAPVLDETVVPKGIAGAQIDREAIS